MNKKLIQLFFCGAIVASSAYCTIEKDKTKHTGTKQEKIKQGYVLAAAGSKVMFNYTGDMIQFVDDNHYIVVTGSKNKTKTSP